MSPLDFVQGLSHLISSSSCTGLITIDGHEFAILHRLIKDSLDVYSDKGCFIVPQSAISFLLNVGAYLLGS
ncbi:hypothetical protein L1987_82621 [Smallanthus sonchifolius]|uniref:Uncharacterized protein n=1 Tax=Smallanthus sonchifolius TaxID=185202 RepID=A0ACB8YBD7_9ASTR|nr:hypothetical protein L1987_82621 [Smallanthus sonchifolius]